MEMFKKFLIVLLLSVFYFLNSSSAWAAKLYFSIPDKVEAGQIFSVQALINPEEFINAVESKIKFDPGLFEFKDFSDANSVINLWVEKPALVGEDTIKFSGIIPGGVGPVVSKESKIITLSFLAKKPGLGQLAFEDFKVYLHQDGVQEASSAATSAIVNVLEADDKTGGAVLVLDFYPPEHFPIYITKAPDLFGGARVAIFSAQDKGSGINRYEIKEKTFGLFGEWRDADSPYVLRNQYPFSIIEVRAVDKVGLERIEKFIPPGFVYLTVGILAILLVLVFTFLAWLIKTCCEIT